MADFTEASPFFRVLAAVSRPVLYGPFRLRAFGLEHVPPAGGFVLASNHTSNLDAWPLALPLYPRQLHFMAKAELYKPVLGAILDATGAFPVRRGERDAEAFKTAVWLAREGGVVAMFPEGTRKSKGLRKKHEARPHPGAARIALAAGVPLVPAALGGTDRLSRLGPVHVAYGSPIELDGLGMTRREAAQEATGRLMEEIARLQAAFADESRAEPEEELPICVRHTDSA
jgi:1-acyl-sn-glycerol-3-phosphate acyltransferase